MMKWIHVLKSFDKKTKLGRFEKDKSDDEYGDGRTDEMYQADSEDNAEWKWHFGKLNFMTTVMSVIPIPTVLIVLSITHVNDLVVEQVMVDHLWSMKNVKT